MANLSLSSKYRIVLIVFGFFMLVNIVLFGWVLTKNPGSTSSKILPILTDNIQQVVVLDSTQVLRLLGSNTAVDAANPLYTALVQSNHIALLQFMGENMTIGSAILVDAKKDFDVMGFIATINMQGDSDYAFHDYGNRVFLFATPDIIARTIQHEGLFMDSALFGRTQGLWDRDVTVFSRIDPDAAVIDNAQVADWIASNEAFVLTLQGTKQGLALDAQLLAVSPEKLGIDKKYDPQLTQYINADTVAFVELYTHILWESMDLSASIQSIRDYDPVVFAGMDDEQITQIIQSPIGIAVENSASMGNLRVALLIQSLQAYEVFAQIFPSLQEPLAALAGLDVSMIRPINESDRVGYHATLMGIIPLVLQSYTDNTTSVLSIGADGRMQSSTKHKTMAAPAHSLGYVFVQFDPLLQLYRQYATLAGQSVQDPFFIQQEKLLKGKQREGYLSVTEQGASFSSIIR